MVHACDIGNPLLPFDTYMNWSYLLAQEFNEQVNYFFKKKNLISSSIDNERNQKRTGSNGNAEIR